MLRRDDEADRHRIMPRVRTGSRVEGAYAEAFVPLDLALLGGRGADPESARGMTFASRDLPLPRGRAGSRGRNARRCRTKGADSGGERCRNREAARTWQGRSLPPRVIRRTCRRGGIAVPARPRRGSQSAASSSERANRSAGIPRRRSASGLDRCAGPAQLALVRQQRRTARLKSGGSWFPARLRTARDHRYQFVLAERLAIGFGIAQRGDQPVRQRPAARP